MKDKDQSPRDGLIKAAWISAIGLVLAAVIAGVFDAINKPDDPDDRDKDPSINASAEPNAPTEILASPSPEPTASPSLEPTGQTMGALLNLDDAKQTQRCKRENFSGYDWVEVSPVVASEEYRAGFACKFGSSDRITGFLEFPVADNTSQFTAVAGIEENAENINFDARFSVLDALTGKVLQEGIATPEDPVEFAVSVSDVSRVRLFVESVGTNESLNDYEGVVAWADPTFE